MLMLVMLLTFVQNVAKVDVKGMIKRAENVESNDDVEKAKKECDFPVGIEAVASHYVSLALPSSLVVLNIIFNYFLVVYPVMILMLISMVRICQKKSQMVSNNY